MLSPDGRTVVVDGDLTFFSVSIHVLIVRRSLVLICYLVARHRLLLLATGELIQHLKNVSIAVTTYDNES